MSNEEQQEVVTNLNEQSNAVGNRPAASFTGSGGIQIAIWKHKSANDYDTYSVRVERSYKDDDGNYKSTSYLRDSDLLRVGKLLELADDWIEQDKSRQRPASARAR
jgi:hypothetical protein